MSWRAEYISLDETNEMHRRNQRAFGDDTEIFMTILGDTRNSSVALCAFFHAFGRRSPSTNRQTNDMPSDLRATLLQMTTILSTAVTDAVHNAFREQTGQVARDTGRNSTTGATNENQAQAARDTERNSTTGPMNGHHAQVDQGSGRTRTGREGNERELDGSQRSDNSHSDVLSFALYNIRPIDPSRTPTRHDILQVFSDLRLHNLVDESDVTFSAAQPPVFRTGMIPGVHILHFQLHGRSSENMDRMLNEPDHIVRMHRRNQRAYADDTNRYVTILADTRNSSVATCAFFHALARESRSLGTNLMVGPDRKVSHSARSYLRLAARRLGYIGWIAGAINPNQRQ